MSFVVDSTLPDCNWFTAADPKFLNSNRSSYQYHPKNLKKASAKQEVGNKNIGVSVF